MNHSAIYITKNLTPEIERAFLDSIQNGNVQSNIDLADMNSIRGGKLLDESRMQELSLKLKGLQAI